MNPIRIKYVNFSIKEAKEFDRNLYWLRKGYLEEHFKF